MAIFCRVSRSVSRSMDGSAFCRICRSVDESIFYRVSRSVSR